MELNKVDHFLQSYNYNKYGHNSADHFLQSYNYNKYGHNSAM